MTPQSYKNKLQIIFEETLIGGVADNKTLEDICNKHKCDIQDLENQLKKGMEVEKEHTTNEAQAKEIAMDHLWEDPKYYDKLQKMEKGECDGEVMEGKTIKFTPKSNAELVQQHRRDWGDVKPYTRIQKGKKGKGSYNRTKEKTFNVDEAKIPKDELEPVNPFAVCTSRVGRDSKDKYERCVKHIKSQNKEENK